MKIKKKRTKQQMVCYFLIVLLIYCICMFIVLYHNGVKHGRRYPYLKTKRVIIVGIKLLALANKMLTQPKPTRRIHIQNWES